MTIQVVLADDQPLVRAGLRVLIADTPGIEVAGEAATGAEAVQLARDLRPDVVLMDIRMPGMDGIEATQMIRAGGDAARVVVLTTFDDDDYVYAALRAGASGFLVKDMALEDILAAIRAVAAGDALIAPSVTRRLIAQLAAQAPPSPASGRTRRHHRTRTRSPHPGRTRHVQRRNRRLPVHQHRHRQGTRSAAARQARRPRPRPARHRCLRSRPGITIRRSEVTAAAGLACGHRADHASLFRRRTVPGKIHRRKGIGRSTSGVVPCPAGPTRPNSTNSCLGNAWQHPVRGTAGPVPANRQQAAIGSDQHRADALDYPFPGRGRCSSQPEGLAGEKRCGRTHREGYGSRRAIS